MNQLSSTPPQRRSKALPIAITLACGILLAAGSCFGFLSTANFGGGRSSAWSWVFFAGFWAGLVAVLVSVIWGIVAIIRYAMRGPEER